jgi:hypothetical protein
MRPALITLLCLFTLVVGIHAQDRGALRLADQDFVLEAEAYPFFRSSEWAGDAGRGVMEPVAWQTFRTPLIYTDGGVEVRAARMLTLSLRADYQWADGSPMTAYDVLYSFLMRRFAFTEYLSPGGMIVNRDRPVDYAAVLDDRTFVLFTSGGEDDDDQALANFPIVSVEVVDPAFAEVMRDGFAGLTSDQPQALLEAAVEVYRYRIVPPDLYDDGLLGQTTRFRFADSGGAPETRLIVGDLPITVALTDSSDPAGRVEDFLARRFDVLVNPPFAHRADLRRLADTRLVEPVGRTWYGLALNLFDPDTRLREEGAPLPPSPFLSDARVRQAIALAIDVEALGEAATSGQYLPFGSVRDWRELARADRRGDPPPAPAPYDPLAARDLLEEAGWKDWDRDGVRECRGCGTATDGARLRLLLLYEQFNDLLPEQRIMARLLSEQLRRVGIEVSPFGSDMFEIAAEVSDARHSLALLRFTERDPIAFNVARAFPQADTFIYLFAERDLYAARTWVTGFDPLPGDPFWNIETWRLAR